MYRRHSRQKIYGKKRQIIGDDGSKVIYHKKEKGEGSEEHKKFWKLQGTEAVQQKEQEYSEKKSDWQIISAWVSCWNNSNYLKSVNRVLVEGKQ